MIFKTQGHCQAVRIDTQAQRLIRLKKGVMTTARLVNDRLKSTNTRWRPVMVTLTYRDVDGWKPDHISDFMNRVNMYAKRRGLKIPYVWVMELQDRGAPHYHVLLWIPARLYLPKADRQGWWVHGYTNLIRVKNSVGYVAKYASKLQSKAGKDMPKGARIHGVGGLTVTEKRIVAWWKLPKDLRTGEEGSVRWTRNEGGGWINRDTGETRESEWGMSATGDKTVLLVKKAPAVMTYRLHDQTGELLPIYRIDRSSVRRSVLSNVSEINFWRGLADDLTRRQLYANDRIHWLNHIFQEFHADPCA